MPQFELVSQAEALEKTTTNPRRAQVMQEYLGYIGRLRAGQAGKLKASSGESLSTVRKRLGAAAVAADKPLVVRRVGDEFLFWLSVGSPRRGRPRRTTQAST